ncbi:hypothetical protein [Methylomagnum ishizawai]|uniref:hypothetical protein n=1 Tax=Methylomagnum ishizawai TaxID=1760988 RepID=UPI001C33A359|nr:hypothetical protein [Methylomagnum ishizawai]BBL75592.1 hypothetical protein MishRS11D_26900 [Methylomagnum ishizawai]
MPFTRRDVHIADVFKIVEAAEEDNLKKRFKRLHILSFPKSWVIDFENNSFLFLVPSESREESCQNHYFLYYLNRYFEIRATHTFGNEISFHRFPKQFESKRKEVQAVFSEAIKVHGRFGYGPNGFNNTLDTILRPDSLDYFEPVYVKDDIQAPSM